MTTTLSQSLQTLRKSTQKPRSTLDSRGRFDRTLEDDELLPQSEILEGQRAMCLENGDE